MGTAHLKTINKKLHFIKMKCSLFKLIIFRLLISTSVRTDADSLTV